MADNIINIALLQIQAENSIEKNMEKGMEYCRKAKQMGADICVFPEMWNNGYTIPEEIEELKSLAIATDSEFVNEYKKLAKELEMAILITLLEKHEPRPRNTAILFDRFGQKLYSYSKVHTCDFGDEARIDSGEDFYVAKLDTAKGIIKVGSMICYDREFPESARILMLKGAELILVPNACPMELNRLSQLRGRAYENMVAIATCNYPGTMDDCNGHSSVFDSVAYLPELSASRDTCILEAGEDEGIYIGELNIDMLREYRRREVHGNAYRRPEKYQILLDEKVEEPFVRKNRKNIFNMNTQNTEEAL